MGESHDHNWVLRATRQANDMDNEDMVAGKWVKSERQIYIFSEWVCECGSFKLVKHYYDLAAVPINSKEERYELRKAQEHTNDTKED